ncbi:paraslipin [Microcoleus sp. FACHB-831]|uniref:SPFH domain-containing protein n=1 Tax=Microcoleus sp. FACHB-831 TaxID=2692827 RepID=UPI001687B662|nr:stomatin-like protein [Microcoleus sp. FACHB-831]MBD1922885.1 paraslipin [Microcoleus sp. FACHB-831]
MDPILSIVAPLVLVIIGSTIGSVKVINEGNQALVERLGRYNRKLSPGVNLVVPFVESIVVEDTTREKVLAIEPQQAITKDNVSLRADAVIYWQILDLEKAYYAVEDVEQGIQNLVLTTLRSAFGQLELEETYSSRNKINQTLLHQLDEATGSWGVKVTRVELRDITPAKTVMESLELERAAESKKRAAILEAEGTVKSIQLLSQALESHPNTREVLHFLVAQRYVDASEKLGESANSKVVFMDPKALNEAINGLMSNESDAPNGNNGNGKI